MPNNIVFVIAKLVERENLTPEEAEHAFQIIMNGGANPAQMAAFLVAMRMKGETTAEITAGAKVMRAKVTPFHAPEGAVDVCGTGGDARGTLNVSTAVAIVVAGCGVPVVKHGNRSVSSKSGSSDVLSALGADVNADAKLMEKSLKTSNLAFLMAPRFHTAMRHIAPVRSELGMRTIFNLLGPLANPAKPTRQVIGVYDKMWLLPIAEVLRELGSEHAWIVHGSDGLDELTTTGISHVAELKDGKIREFTITPEDAGLPLATLKDIQGGDAQHNAEALTRLLSKTASSYRDIVLLNASAALIVAGKVKNLKDGVAMAAQSIDSGNAKEALATLVTLTSEYEVMKVPGNG